MNSVKLILFLFIISQSVHGQFAFNNIEFKLKNPPSSRYKIIQTEKGKLKKILEFNNEGKIIFDYRETEIPPFFKWKEPHRFIYANEYDTSGRIIKRYDFNSNAGLSIYSYEYGQNPLTKTLYKQKYTESKETEKNTNANAFISKFKNFEQLKESDEVANIISSPKIKGYIENLNQNNKPIEIKEYSRMYGDTIITSLKYNSKGEELLKRVVGTSTNEIKREVISEFKQNSEITEIINFRNGEKKSVYRFAESKNQVENTETKYSERNGILNIRHYTFDKDGYLIKVIVFETDYKGDLIIPVTSDLKKTSEMLYKYNKDGLLEKEIMTNYKTGKKDTRKYKYQIETE
tara:strand:- start:115 stop:1155 length:1041 start_codon:yes stop_codon:yes gene_type:complete